MAMEQLPIQDPAKAEEMAYAEKPHVARARAAEKIAAATKLVDGHAFALASKEYAAAGGENDFTTQKASEVAMQHQADAEAAGTRAGITYDSVQRAMAEPLPGSAEHLASLPNPPVVHYKRPTLPDSRGKGNLPPLPGSDQKAA